MPATVPTLETLYRAAVAHGFPPADVRDALAELADTLFSRPRLEDLDGPQRADLLDTIQAHADPPEPAADDPPRPVTAGQRERLYMIAGELGWTAGQLDRWIRHARPAGQNVARLADVTIARQADPIITHLEAVVRDKRRRRQAIRLHAAHRQAQDQADPNTAGQAHPHPSARPTTVEQPAPPPPRSPFDAPSNTPQKRAAPL